ncbi:hypothetical protein Cni_G02755 [Canna indica]|uniref:Receptor ligand binding region domain-containing protein n=1 Tax=Canna indica TaxID=4628 RepID=A0AAQ3JPX7_9LILI|nr:hypothetical protein Cni_G02755 [Canna indica]
MKPFHSFLVKKEDETYIMHDLVNDLAQFVLKFLRTLLLKRSSIVEILLYQDIIILNCTENMDKGKMYTYFSSVPHLFDASTYDYVMKADDNTCSQLHSLAESLRKMPREDVYSEAKTTDYDERRLLLQQRRGQAIIGPPKTTESRFVLALGDRTHVPVLSFSATCPSLSAARTLFFVRTTHNDSSQVDPIAPVVGYYGWRCVIAVYEDIDYGTGIVPFLMDALHRNGAVIPYHSVIPSAAIVVQLEKELYRLMTLQTRVFVVHMLFDLGTRSFRKAKEVGAMTEQYVWITTDGITNDLDLLERKVIESMHGVIGVRLYMNKSTEMIKEFESGFIQRFHAEMPSSRKTIEPALFDFWAYDMVWAVAMAVETAGASRLPSSNAIASSFDLLHLDTAAAGAKLLKAIHMTHFRGLCGEFQLVHGQLPPPVFEIVNIIGDGKRAIGYWMLKPYIVRLPESNCKSELKQVIWPGDSKTMPKGWQIPTLGKRLRIGVPVTAGFKRFVSVDRDPTNNTTIVQGYCIDVFRAVINALPFAVLYDFIPFETRTTASYDDLVYQVHLKVIFDEIPYLQIFLSKYCRDFSLVGPTDQTAGFGFVSFFFP